MVHIFRHRFCSRLSGEQNSAYGSTCSYGSSAGRLQSGKECASFKVVAEPNEFTTAVVPGCTLRIDVPGLVRGVLGAKVSPVVWKSFCRSKGAPAILQLYY